MSKGDNLHRAVAQYLDLVLPANVWWTTIAHGNFKLPIHVGARLKRLGLKRGCPDILIVHNARAKFVELKEGSGYVTKQQRAIHDAIRLAGGMVVVVRGLDDMETFVRTEGMIR